MAVAEIASARQMRPCAPSRTNDEGTSKGDIIMTALGIILLILGFLFAIPILWTIGIILTIVGVVLMLVGAGGRTVLGRRHYW